MTTTMQAKQSRMPTVTQLLGVLLSRRRRISRVVILAILAAVLAKVVVPRSYTSEAAVMPRMPKSGSGVAGIAAQFGLNLAGADALQLPDFYATAVHARVVLEPFLRRELPEYLKTDKRRLVLSVFATGPVELDETLDDALRQAPKQISVQVERRTGVLFIGVKTRDAELSQWLMEALLDGLDSYNASLRAAQARAELVFSEHQIDDARARLRAAEDALQSFLQANVDLGSAPRLQFARERLEREVAARQGVYTSILQTAEQARVEERRDTPILSRVSPASRPLRGDARGTLLFAALVGAIALLAMLLIETVETDFSQSPNTDDEARAAWAAEITRYRSWSRKAVGLLEGRKRS